MKIVNIVFLVSLVLVCIYQMYTSWHTLNSGELTKSFAICLMCVMVALIWTIFILPAIEYFKNN